MAIMDYPSGMESAKESGIAIGEKRGEQRGEKRGIAKGVDQYATLILNLHAAGRDDEIVKAATNPSLRKKLFKEFNL